MPPQILLIIPLLTGQLIIMGHVKILRTCPHYSGSLNSIPPDKITLRVN